MPLTMSLDKLNTILERVMYAPHREVAATGVRIPQTLRAPGLTTLFISPGSVLDITAEITLDDWVMLGAGAKLWTHNHDFQKIPREIPALSYAESHPLLFTYALPKTIGRDVWIFDATILAQCTSIAQGCIIATGAVCTKPILEPYTIWGGVPARKIGVRP